MRKLFFDIGSVSDTGIKREVNQDKFFFKTVETDTSVAGIFSVADGVGGLNEGDVASSFVISNFSKWWEEEFKNHFGDKEYIAASLIKCVMQTNSQLVLRNSEDTKRRATTLSALLIYEHEYFIVHTGDSRIYEANRKIVQLTKDHSAIVEQNVGQRLAKKSVLTQCIGAKNNITPFYASGQIRKNSVFIICSDGIYKKISDCEILKTVRANKDNVQQTCQSLVDIAKGRGETDDITIIAVNLN